MKHDNDSLRLRPEGLAVTGALLAVGQLAAQAPAPAEKKQEEGAQKNEELSEVVVSGKKEQELYKPERLQSPKQTQPLRDIAQTVTVVPKEVIKEQNASSLRDVLRNVPGISMQAGEGGGGPAGDNLSIRGFAARSDIFVDGMRDAASGGYIRDSFNIEQVEVTKGPASASTGRGSTGGSINIVTKMPTNENAYGLMLGGGSDEFIRGTFDVNQTIPGLNGAAVRLNGMYHDQNIPGRSEVENQRWGVAPSIAFGLGTNTRLTVNLLHQEQDNVPDYGIPWIPRNSKVPTATSSTTTFNHTGLPSGAPPEYLWRNYYGNLSRDYEDVQTDIITAILEHDFNDCLKLRSTLRFGRNDRDSITTAPRFVDGNNTTPIVDYDSTQLTQQFQSRDQIDTAIFSQTDIRYDFQTGDIEHKLVGGLEFGREKSTNYGRGTFNPATGAATSAPVINLFWPNNYKTWTGIIRRNGAITETVSDTAAIYLFDTIKFNEHWELAGGGRWDSYDVDYTARTADVHNGTNRTNGVVTSLKNDASEFSYRAALTYKPVEEGSIYLAYGTSFNPATENLTYIAAPTATNNTLALFNTDPEENETIELGSKWEFFDQRLLLSGAIFRTEKTNARTTDVVDPTNVSLTGEQVVEGFELGVTGSVTDNFRLIGGYTYLSSEVKQSLAFGETGSEVSNTPENSFSLWAVYDLPKNVQVGLGTQYVDSRYNNNNRATRQEAPDFFLVNAMAGYAVNDNLSFRLNVDNILDEEYIDRVGGGHFVPGQGRSVFLSASLNF